jgi:hypothetical protein
VGELERAFATASEVGGPASGGPMAQPRGVLGVSCGITGDHKGSRWGCRWQCKRFCSLFYGVKLVAQSRPPSAPHPTTTPRCPCRTRLHCKARWSSSGA